MSALSTSRRAEPAGSTKRVLIVCEEARAAVPDRRALLAAIIERRHRVKLVALDLSTPERVELGSLGIEVTEPTSALPGGYQTTASLNSKIGRAWLKDVIDDLRPNVMFALGSHALLQLVQSHKRQAETRIVGELMRVEPGELTSRVKLGWLSGRPKPGSLSGLGEIICHTPFELEQLEAYGHLRVPARRLEVATTIVPGAGINLDRFAQVPLPGLDKGLKFLFAGPERARSGLLEFLGAAAKVATIAGGARFVVLRERPGGVATKADTAVTAALARSHSLVEVVDEPADIRPQMAACHVLLRVAYEDSLPTVLLAGLAMGRPLITSSNSGCREMVDERVNGILVSPGNVDALADAMVSVLKRPDLLPAMAAASRRKAERWFDERTAVAGVLQALQL